MFNGDHGAEKHHLTGNTFRVNIPEALAAGVAEGMGVGVLPVFACKSNAHTFIAGLINDDSIDRDPTHVEANSVNAFRPAQGSDLTAFGYPVHDVFGYEHNDAMFKRGGGEALAGSLYGAVVSAPTEEVEARAQGRQRRCRSRGSAARAHRHCLQRALTRFVP